ncbi:MAG: type II toxin-antitoxin system HicB family antitoxin [Lachnospiraceae bacterium]
MYKYCRDVMWSVEDDAFIATVVELPECKAKGKTVVEAMNNLDIAIEEWIKNAKKMGKVIPDPLYYEPEDLAEVQEDEKVPHYDSVSRTWKVVTEWGSEEGDAIYIASEFVKGGLFYPFHSEPSWKEQYYNHAHDFESVVSFLLERPAFFSIAGYEDYYSQQERELLDQLRMKLHIPNEETMDDVRNEKTEWNIP